MNPIIIISGIVVLFCVVLTCVILVEGFASIKRFQKNKPQLPKNFSITAHTGCMGTSANSIDSMQKGIEAGAGIVEFDLQFDKNGKPVLSHNVPTGKTVSLDEAFEFLAGHRSVRANIDVKNVSDIGTVNVLAEKYNVWKQIFFTGVYSKDVSAVERSCPRIPYYLNYPVNSKGSRDAAYISHVVETVQNCGAIGINMNYKSVSVELVEAFHEAGLLVSLWTVNKKCDMCRVLRCRPDNVTTKRPDILCELLKKPS